ncbi:MAG: FISUMP domain-containing protein, partial [Patescibacteria group bacterium]
CVTSGGFYQWAEALQLPFACNAVDCSSAPGDPCCAFEVPRQGICPSGWHIPSDAERLELNTYLGTTVGTKLKAAPGIWDGDNASGFNALPVGYRATWGGFPSQGIETRFWSSSATGSSVWTFYLNSSQSDLNHGNYEDRLSGISVRCIKD